MRRLHPWFRDRLIEHLAPTEFQYRAGGLFELRRPETHSYLEFVPGKYPTPESIVDVRVNIGITCLTLNSVFPRPLSPTTLDEGVHWLRGSGYISDDSTGPEDWLVDKDGDAPFVELFHELDNRIVPELLKRTTNEALLVDWTSARDWQLTAARQAAFVAVLAAKRGDWVEYGTAIETIAKEAVTADGDLNRRHAGELLDIVRVDSAGRVAGRWPT
jgi:hypothetical protein